MLPTLNRALSTIPKKPSFFRTHYRKIKWATILSVATATTVGLYTARNPPAQEDFDPSKKNLVILGSGWASTSILKDLDTKNFNVTVISPRNYFLFTPLLPSCTVGTLELRSIMQPIRFITRLKSRVVKFIEGETAQIDPMTKKVTVKHDSKVQGVTTEYSVPYDYLVMAVGAENATFGIKGVEENACFLKEISDAQKIRTKLMDCIESATFPGQSDEEIKRLLHMVVVGGGPTGVEYAGELHDFLTEDLKTWYPDIADKVKISLIEALPHVLPMFSKQLIEYTEGIFAENKVLILNNTKVKEVKPKELTVLNSKNELETIPYGLLVWATGNKPRAITTQLISKLPSNLQNQRRGLVVDEHLQVLGADDIYALGDVTATQYPATAQVASKQGQYLAKRLNAIGAILNDTSKLTSEQISTEQIIQQLPPFKNQSMGMLASIGSDRAIADLPGGIRFGGLLTFYFWRSAYLSNLFTLRNKFLVFTDWTKKFVFGRDIGRE